LEETRRKSNLLSYPILESEMHAMPKVAPMKPKPKPKPGPAAAAPPKVEEIVVGNIKVSKTAYSLSVKANRRLKCQR
jgi:hypothetical protein